MQYYQKSKYGSRWCRCINGHNHQSRGEAGYCNDLTLQQKAGVFEKYESQKRFELHGKNGKKISNHYVDFLIKEHYE